MQPSQDSLRGARVVVLHKLVRQAQFFELVRTKYLLEKAALVSKHV
jgi:hypothetical protein